MNQSNVTVQQLGVEAALTGDPELVVAAIAMDPLTSSVLTLKEIRDMTIEMFEGEQTVPAAFWRQATAATAHGQRPRRTRSGWKCRWTRPWPSCIALAS